MKNSMNGAAKSAKMAVDAETDRAHAHEVTNGGEFSRVTLVVHFNLSPPTTFPSPNQTSSLSPLYAFFSFSFVFNQLFLLLS